MKNKYLSLALVAGLLAAFLWTANCICIFGDCHAVASQISKSSLPNCHLGAGPVKTQENSPTGCCQKCQIEKAAVLYKKVFSLGYVSQKNIMSVALFVVTDSKTPHLFCSFYRKFHTAFSGFFLEKILTSTLSFRAPPVG